MVPVNVRKSQELISEDVHTSKKSYKFAFSVELVPICKDDLVCLPIPMAKSLGNISPLVLCHRIGTSVYFVDPNTLQTADLHPDIYWRAPFVSLADAPDLVEFMVLNIEPTGPSKGRWLVADVEVTRIDDMQKSYNVRTHLGNFLHVGDSVMGYMLTGTNFNNPQFEAMEDSKYGSRIPDVMLVKKYWPRNRKHRNRKWRLKRMAKDEGELLPKKADQERMDNEYELFLRDVEEDDELRAALALYKNTNKNKKPQEGAMDMDTMSVAETDGAEMDDEDAPQVNMDELLDDFDELTVEDRE